jgi:hypothetical protein
VTCNDLVRISKPPLQQPKYLGKNKNLCTERGMLYYPSNLPSEKADRTLKKRFQLKALNN